MKHARITSEEEYFLKHEMERNCPKCGMDLTEIEFRGIRVDRCFVCEGTWFDAGEVEAATHLGKSTLDSIFTLFKKDKKA
jgi:uncharacterized protein